MDHRTWPERPCSRKWRRNERPCQWFKWGHDCNRQWDELIHPADYIVQGIMHGNVVVALGICVVLLRKSRRHRSRAHGERRRPTSFGVPPRPGDWNRFETYNDYERTVLWIIGACLCQVIAFVDLSHNDKAMAYYFKALLWGLIRSFFDLALFQVMSAFRTTLRGFRDLGVPVGGSIGMTFQIVTNLMEIFGVPAHNGARIGNACWRNDWNFIKHFGGGIIENGVTIYSISVVLRIRRRLILNDNSKSRIDQNSKVVSGIIWRILMLSGIAFVGLLFGIVVGFRSQGPISCMQPYCTLPLFLGHVYWSICYVCINWYCVLFLTIGGPSSDDGSHPKKTRRPSYFARPSAILRPPRFIKDDDIHYVDDVVRPSEDDPGFSSSEVEDTSIASTTAESSSGVSGTSDSSGVVIVPSLFRHDFATEPSLHIDEKMTPTSTFDTRTLDA